MEKLVSERRLLEQVDIENIKRHARELTRAPRVPGTDTHADAHHYLTETLTEIGMVAMNDEFDEDTPYGKKTFANIVAGFPPPRGDEAVRFFLPFDDAARHQLVLAAHYDSKYFPHPNHFVGAIDSAVPCAIILELARLVGVAFTEEERSRVSVMFFDGEEAFKDWTAADSLYGSRHLAAKMKKEKIIDRIGCLVLLDLIGVASAKAAPLAFMPQSDRRRFDTLFRIEKTLRSGHSALIPVLERVRIFKETSVGFRNHNFVEDDHVPFLREKVPVLHLISTPFPSQWHKFTDTYDSIDFALVEALTKILALFLAHDDLIAS